MFFQKCKMNFSHLCAYLAVQAQCSCFMNLLPISVQKLEHWIPPTTEIVVEFLDAAGESCSKRTFST